MTRVKFATREAMFASEKSTALLSCVPAPVVHAPISVVVEPAPACPEMERVLVDDALPSTVVDAGDSDRG